mmetsp:Transcript_6072/g.14522  ORF Transcript_6072/g.14522 Transcript_6072/m.14522 type:complete len:454 (+) Transcript_6072:1966-3327(+)
MGKSVHGSVEHRPKRCKIHQYRHVGMLAHGFIQGGVHRKQHLIGAPVELHVVIATEGIDNGANRRSLALADEIKIHHPLNGALLHTIDDARCLWTQSGRNGPRRYLATSIGMLHHLPLILVDTPCGWLKSTSCLDGSGRGSRRRVRIQIRLRKHLRETQGHWNDSANMRLRPVDADWQPQLLASALNQTQSFLIVGTSTTHPDLDIVRKNLLLKRLQCLYQPSEGRCNIGEICDTTSNNQYLAVWVLVLAHQPQDCLRILETLFCGWRPGILPIVCELLAESIISNRVRVNDRSATSRHHGPHAAFVIKDGEFQAGSCLAVHVSNFALFRVLSPAKGRREIQVAPCLANQKVSRLVDLGCQVKRNNTAIVQHHQGVYLEIRKMQVLVCLEQCRNESCKSRLPILRNRCEQRLRNLRFCNLRIGRNHKPQRLRVDVPNIDTTLVMEKDHVIVAV